MAQEHRFPAGEVYRKTSPDVLAAFLQDETLIEDGYQSHADGVVVEYTAQQENGSYPDLLNKDATAYFIAITHDGYAAALQPALGQHVTAVFTDEPKANVKAFRKELAEQYEAEYGESILPYLPLIAQRVAPTEETVHVLQRWFDLYSRAFCNSFLLPCKNWANEHGLAFTGHMDVDHDPLGCMRGGGNFHLMRALRCLDIPGIDVIWQQIYPEDRAIKQDGMNAYNGFFPRYAASAAVQNGSKRAMAEVFGVAGPGLTYDAMRYTVGYLAVRGINVFNLFNFQLGRKDALLAQELPIFTESQVFYRYLPLFNRYIERLSYLSTLGERVCETALYYPISDFHGGLHADAVAAEFDVLGRALEDRLVDFDIVDDDVILAAEGVENGCLRFGKATYKHIVIPQNATFPSETEEILHRFVAGGGRISHDPADPTPVLPVEGSGLRAMRRSTGNGDLFCLFREGGEQGSYQIRLSAKTGYLLDLASASMQRIWAKNGVYDLTLAVGETAVILLTEDVFAAEEYGEFSKSFPIAHTFRFGRELELACGKNGFETVRHTDAASAIELGDWCKHLGAAYSGSGVYETTFTLPLDAIGKVGEIDLGDVRFAAEVVLNGNPLGVILAPPYRVRIPDGVLQQENRLEITVTNTSANWYVHTDYFDKWETNELSPYFAGSLEYAKECVSGGLYGPITLYTE